jgi:hypothetical protein
VKHLKIFVRRTQISVVYVAVPNSVDPQMLKDGLYSSRLDGLAKAQLHHTDWSDDSFAVDDVEVCSDAYEMAECEHIEDIK